MNRFLKLTEPVIKNSQELTKMGNAGYDNPRENIDPDIQTKVIDCKEIIQNGVSYDLSTFGGAGANTELSNLGTTAINANLRFNIADSAYISAISGATIFINGGGDEEEEDVLGGQIKINSGNTGVGTGGAVIFSGGEAWTGLGIGGHIEMSAGEGENSYGNAYIAAKDILLTLNSGNFIINSLPTSDPSVAGAVFASAGVLRISAG